MRPERPAGGAERRERRAFPHRCSSRGAAVRIDRSSPEQSDRVLERKSERPVLALDLDELLFPFVENFVTYVNENQSRNHKFDDFHTYSFEVVMQSSLTEI